MERKLRLALIYPPPWRVPTKRIPLPPGLPFGPPAGGLAPELDGDADHITYGLYTIAATARRQGYEVVILNAFRMNWAEVTDAISGCDADVFGISAFTANRRGMGAVAALVRELYPRAHIVAGGPFVTALPKETLEHYPEIDSVVVGEGEHTLLELLDRLGAGAAWQGVAGTAWREHGDIRFGALRPRIDRLDDLPSPFDYFTSHIVMTSRGCPSKCTFCGSFTTWGKKLRFHSVEASLNLFAGALERLRIPFLVIKDDTFTADRRRAVAICEQIIARGMNFAWTCDSRVDSLDDDLLRKMRLAGCQAISLGVESGSPEILRSIGKKTTPEMIVEATRAARSYGMYVRHYMMIGNRGETPQSVQASIDLIRACRPNGYVFTALSIYPGTPEWEILKSASGATNELFFRHDFMELCVAAGREASLEHVLMHIKCAIGAPYGFDYSVEEREAIIGRIPESAMAHAELANAYLRCGRLDDAWQSLDRAEELFFPVSSVLDNQRACVASARGDIGLAEEILSATVQAQPGAVVSANLNAIRHWRVSPAERRPARPQLNDVILVPAHVDLQAPLGR